MWKFLLIPLCKSNQIRGTCLQCEVPNPICHEKMCVCMCVGECVCMMATVYSYQHQFHVNNCIRHGRGTLLSYLSALQVSLSVCLLIFVKGFLLRV